MEFLTLILAIQVYLKFNTSYSESSNTIGCVIVGTLNVEIPEVEGLLTQLLNPVKE